MHKRNNYLAWGVFLHAANLFLFNICTPLDVIFLSACVYASIASFFSQISVNIFTNLRIGILATKQDK